MDDITLLLQRSQAGDRDAEQALVEAVYQRLRLMAAHALAHERPGHTLQPTALVHEAYLRLLGKGVVNWQDRGHFFCVAARTMRRILVDHARKRTAAKAGAAGIRYSLEDVLEYGERQDPMLLRLHDSLDALASRDPRQVAIVELRYFGGLTEEEIGLVLGVSTRTVKRDWMTARAWLNAELAR